MDDFARLRVRKGGKITARWGNAILRLIQRATITSVVGGRLKQDVTTQLFIPPRFTPAGHPFKVHTELDPELGLRYYVESGSFNILTPTLGGTSIATTPHPTGALETSGDYYVYLKISATLSVESAYVYSYSYTAAVIEAASAVPSDTKTSPASYYIPLAKFIDGVKNTQYVTTSLNGFVEDDGTAASRGNLIYFQA